MLDRLPLQLSGGQQQRTAIARALVKQADLVLMDKPLANLDYKLREELPRIFEATGAIFVYATTEPSEALMLGGSTAALSKGRVTQFGPASADYLNPHDIVTAGVVSDPPSNTGQASIRGVVAQISNAANSGAELFAHLADGDYTLGFRAHQLYLERPAVYGLTFPAVIRVAVLQHGSSRAPF